MMFDEEQVRAHWRLLGHLGKGVTELTVIRDRGWNLTGFFDDEDKFVEACREHAGLQNTYVAVQPRKRELFELAPNTLKPLGQRGKSVDASHICALFIDIDVDTTERTWAAENSPDGKAAATEDELNGAVEAARQIAQWDVFEHPVLAMSGNGAYLLASLDLPSNAEIARKLKAFENALIDQFSDLLQHKELRVDSTAGDRSQLMTIMGTYKIKGDPRTFSDRPHRSACFLDVLPERVVDKKLEAYIQSLAPKPLSISTDLGTSTYVPEASFAAPPELCAAWAEIYETKDRVRNQRGKMVRYALHRLIVAALRHTGYAFNSIRDALVEHDHHLGQKTIEEGSDPDRYTKTLLDSGADLSPTYLCKAVPDVLGHDQHCRNCELKASEPAHRSTRCRRVPAVGQSDVDLNTEAILSRDEARSEMDRALSEWMQGALEGDQPRPLLIKGFPGLGKTFHVIQNLIRHTSRPGDTPFRFMYLIDRLERMNEVVAEMMQTQVGREQLNHLQKIRGKLSQDEDGQSLCRQGAKVGHLRQKNYMLRESPLTCFSPCSHRKECPYLRQFEATDKSWLMTLDYLFTERMAQANEPEIVICDESFLRHMLSGEVEVQVGDIQYLKALLQNIGFDAETLLCFLDHLIVVIEDNQIAGYRKDKVENGLTLRLHLTELVGDVHSVCEHYLGDEGLKEALERIERGHLMRLPLNFVIPLLKILCEEEGMQARNSRLSVEIRGGKPTLVIREPRRPKIGNLPLIVLDATADKELYEMALGREVDALELPVGVEAWVQQLAAGAYGKSSMEIESGKPSARDRLFRLARLIVEEVAKLASREDGSKRKVGIITFKDLVDPLREHLGDWDPPIEYANYWGLRGMNRMQDCQHVILLGTPMVGLEKLKAWVSALHWDDDELDTTSLEAWERLGPARGKGEDIEVLVWRFLDPRLQRFAWQFREAELIQAMGRIRPLDDPLQKNIWLISNVPVPGFRTQTIFESQKELKDYLNVPVIQQIEGTTAKERIKNEYRAYSREGETPPTIRQQAEKFRVSESWVKVARREVREEERHDS